MCVCLHSCFVENHPIQILEDGPLISEVVLSHDGLSILQYVDDTIIFLDHDLKKDKNLKVHLCAFEKLSVLKINFRKCEMYCFGEAKEDHDQYSAMFGCQGGEFPLKYLGIPMHYRKLSNKDRKKVEERIEK
jgi:hypothetical protein